MHDESEERYRAVIEHLSEGMLVVQGERVVFANQRAAEIAGMKLEEMREIGFLTRVHPDDQALVLDRQRRRLAGEEVPSRYELRILLPDGAIRWIGIGVAVVPWGGQPAALIFFGDITERKAMVEALHRSEERYRAVVEHVGDGMVVVQDGRFVFVNQRATEIVRLSRDEMLANGFLHSIHPDDRELVLDRQRRRFAGEAVPDRYELRLQHRDGAVTWIEIGVTMVPWDGKPGTLTFFSDVGQRKALEARLRQTLGEREALLNSAQVGIAFNVNRRFEWVNDEFIHMMGYEREQLVGQSTRILYNDDETHRREGAATREVLEREGTYYRERQLVQKGGDTIWVQLAGRCVHGKDPDAGVIWTLLDITERRRAEDDIREALRKQRELNDLRSRFVAMTSHEFRTPLAAILSSAELLRHYGERMDAQEKSEVLQGIEAGVQRMTAMLDRVLLIGKADAQMLEFKPSEIDLAGLCEKLAEEAGATPHARRCRIVTEFGAARRSGLYDEKLLRHALGNLLSNAVKYSPGGGEVRFSVADRGGRVEFSVADQGLGIPPQEIPHLFAAFHRASNVGDIQGTGLGLMIVKKSVELHGGQVEVQSELGKGTRFTVLI
ncbi:MAG: PAS domain S-box protein [Burkholderiaceae bacterium]